MRPACQRSSGRHPVRRHPGGRSRMMRAQSTSTSGSVEAALTEALWITARAGAAGERGADVPAACFDRQTD